MTDVELLTEILAVNQSSNELLVALCVGVAVALFVMGVNAWRILK